jgi:BASS family bile acid:Na+ symporter
MELPKLGLKINDWLERLMFVWILLSMAIGYLFSTFLAHGEVAIVFLFGFMTAVTASGTKLRELLYIVQHPWVLAAMLGLSHILLPIIALILGRTLLHTHADVVGIVLASSIPVGVTSVMWVGMAKGNPALSVAMVSLDTLLSPLVIPATVHLLIGSRVGLPFWTLFWGLVWMVVLPTAIGISINELSHGKAKQHFQPMLGPLSKLSMLAVVAINVASVTPFLESETGALGRLLAVIAGIGSLGFLVSFVFARIVRRTRRDTVTMTYSVGIRNISAGIAIAGTYFGHAVAIPVVLGMLFQQPLATVVFWMLRGLREQRC